MLFLPPTKRRKPRGSPDLSVSLHHCRLKSLRLYARFRGNPWVPWDTHGRPERHGEMDIAFTRSFSSSLVPVEYTVHSDNVLELPNSFSHFLGAVSQRAHGLYCPRNQT